jgi:hypothetical protein
MLQVRGMGLITCVHFAELPNMSEADDILSFKPSRLGHGCFMTEEQVTSRVPLT